MANNRPVRFIYHILPMFTEEHRLCMQGVFDLKSYADVKANAEAIYDRVSDETMPADDSRPWPNEWKSLFRRWIDEGCAE